MKILRSRSDRMLKECYRKFKEHAANTILSNPKHIWSYVNNLKRNSGFVPNETMLGDKIVSGGQEISNFFSDYFQSVCQLKCRHIIMAKGSQNDLTTRNWSSTLGIVSLTVSEITGLS